VIQTSVRLFLKTGVHIERICKAAAIFLLYCNSNSHRTDSDGAAIQPTPSKIIPSASVNHNGDGNTQGILHLFMSMFRKTSFQIN
jgi:hypothetical protein